MFEFQHNIDIHQRVTVKLQSGATIGRVIVKTTEPLVTVITPSYNHEAFLEERIASIEHQTYRNIEWIVIDDNSRDNSVEIWEAHHKKTARNMAIIKHGKNVGLGRTVMEAIALSRGQYIYRAESDDSCDLSLIEAMVEMFRLHPSAEFCFARALAFGASKATTAGWRQPKQNLVIAPDKAARRLARRNFICGGAVMFSKKLHVECGGFYDGTCEIACDYHFSLRASAHTPFLYVGVSNVYHREHAGNYSRLLSLNMNLDSLEKETYGVANAAAVYLRAHGRIKDRDQENLLRRCTYATWAPLYKETKKHDKEQASRILDIVSRNDKSVNSHIMLIAMAGATAVSRFAMKTARQVGAQLVAGVRS